jgi:hypothetical protein
MTNIAYELFRQILIETDNKMSFEEFCAAHEHIARQV